MNRRNNILDSVTSVLKNKFQEYKEKAKTTLLETGKVDGPWQSKQPDEMMRLEREAQTYESLAYKYGQMSEELERIKSKPHKKENIVDLGSIVMWKLNGQKMEPTSETIIITPSGGGQIDNYRLVSEKAPITKAILGKKAGEIIKSGEVIITIEEVI